MKEKRKYIIFFLLLVVITGFFFMFKSHGAEEVELEPIVNKKTKTVKKQKFSMWKKESSTDSYTEIQIVPNGLYKLNRSLTNCVDMNGDAVNYMPVYSNGKVTVTSGNTIFCNLYFDKVFDGEGTNASPYQIKIIENLVDLSILTNEGNDFSNTYFAMTRNLDFNSTSSYGDYTRTDYGDINGDNTVEALKTELTKSTGIGFTPIGESTNTVFGGSFDGANYTLSNIYINNTKAGDYRNGLFGVVEDATLENLTITGTMNTSRNTAGLTGSTKGTTTITNVHSGVNVTIDSGSYSAGGIVGSNFSDATLTITNCTNTGTITNGGDTGGIIAYNGGTVIIDSCTNTGTVYKTLGLYTGGILGRSVSGSNNTISNCINNGLVKANTPDGTASRIGGIMGALVGTATFTNNRNLHAIGSDTVDSSTIKYIGGIVANVSTSSVATVSECYNTGNITGGSRVGGISGLVEGHLIIDKSYNTGNLSSTSTYSSINLGGIVGHNYNSNSAANNQLIILNTYNEGTINSSGTGGGLVGSNTGSSSSAANPVMIVINCYNVGGVTAATYARGLVGNGGYGITYLNNVYNYASVSGGSSSYGVSSHSGTALYLDSAYYLTGISGVPSSTSGTPVALTANQISNQANYNGQPFVTTLNTNVSGITLSTYDSAIASYGLLSWKHSSAKGYPIFSDEAYATITATKKTAGTEVASNTWSNEGLNFSLTAPAGATIYYCKDTANTCSPGTTTTSGSSITSYNTATGTYYIRYKTISNGVSSSIRSYTAKVDTTAPAIVVDLNTTTISATLTDSDSGVAAYSFTNSTAVPSTYDYTFAATASKSITKSYTLGTTAKQWQLHVGDAAGNNKRQYIYAQKKYLAIGDSFTQNSTSSGTVTCSSSNTTAVSCAVSGSAGSWTATITALATGTSNVKMKYSNGSVVYYFSVTVDDTAPTITVDHTGSSFTANLADSGSGLAAYAITTSSSTPAADSSSWVAISGAPSTFTTPSTSHTSGYKYVYAKDVVGKTKKFTVWAGSQALSKNETWSDTASTTASTFTCTSSSTSIATCAVSGSSGSWTYSITGKTSNGTSVVKYTVGTSTLWVYNVTVDVSGPTIILDYNGTNITGTITDSGSGVVADSLTTTNTTPSTWTNTYTATSSKSVSYALSSGSRYVYAKDAVGNVSNRYIAISSVTIGKNGTSTISSSVADSNLTCTSSKTSVATCAVSGSSGSWTITITGVAGGTAVIKVKLSNGSVRFYRTVTVDATAPTITVNHTGSAFTAALSDSGSGLAAYAITTSSTAPASGSSDWVAISGTPSSYTTPSTSHTSGYKYVYAKDAVGNVKKFTVWAVSRYYGKNETWSNTATNAVSTFTCTSSNTSIATCGVTGSSGNWTYSITAKTSNGSTVIKYTVGTSTLWVYNATVDVTAPTITITHNGSSLAGTITDSSSKVAAYAITSSSSTPSSWTTVTDATSINIPSTTHTNSTKYVHAKDSVGNATYESVTYSTGYIKNGTTAQIFSYSGTTAACESTSTSIATCAMGGSSGAWTVNATAKATGTTYIKMKVGSQATVRQIRALTVINAPTAPTITASDSKASGSWHKANFSLSFSGSTLSGNGQVVYYYGTSTSSMTSSGTSASISSATSSTTYYVKACNSLDTSICSSNSSYVVKLDKTAPTIVLTHTGTAIGGTITDSASKISKYIATSSSTAPSSGWANGGSAETVTLPSIAHSSGWYYVYAEDVAGNQRVSSVNVADLSVTSGSSTTVTSSDSDTLTCTSSATGKATCTRSGSAGNWTFTIAGVSPGSALVTIKRSNGSAYYVKRVTVNGLTCRKAASASCPAGYETKTWASGCWSTEGNAVTAQYMTVKHTCDNSGGTYEWIEQTVYLNSSAYCTPTSSKTCNYANLNYYYYTNCTDRGCSSSTYYYPHNEKCYASASYTYSCPDDSERIDSYCYKYNQASCASGWTSV